MFNIPVRQLKLFAIAWLFFISFLFFLPGTALPKQNWLADIHFDKWVHFGFFAILLFLWRFYFAEMVKYSLLLLAVALLYGLAVELVQHFFIANRSFDVGDLIADMAGTISGILFWGWYKKNRPL